MKRVEKYGHTYTHRTLISNIECIERLDKRVRIACAFKMQDCPKWKTVPMFGTKHLAARTTFPLKMCEWKMNRSQSIHELTVVSIFPWHGGKAYAMKIFHSRKIVDIQISNVGRLMGTLNSVGHRNASNLHFHLLALSLRFVVLFCVWFISILLLLFYDVLCSLCVVQWNPKEVSISTTSIDQTISIVRKATRQNKTRKYSSKSHYL